MTIFKPNLAKLLLKDIVSSVVFILAVTFWIYRDYEQYFDLNYFVIFVLIYFLVSVPVTAYIIKKGPVVSISSDKIMVAKGKEEFSLHWGGISEAKYRPFRSRL